MKTAILFLILTAASLPAAALEKLAMINCYGNTQTGGYEVAADVRGTRLEDNSWQADHADIRFSQAAGPQLSTVGYWQDVPVTGEGLGLTFSNGEVNFFAFFDDIGGVSSIRTSSVPEVSLTCDFTEL